MAEKRLGAGLEALFGDLPFEKEEVSERKTLPIAKIEPRADQPREVFDEERLEELAESIREHGLLQPLTVRELGGGFYQIIAGERRWRAARMAGLNEVPVYIIDADDQKASVLALVENLQREDLNPIEEAKGYRVLMSEHGMTQEQAAAAVGKSRPVIANAVRLLSLPESILELISSGRLSMSQGRALLELKNDEDRLAAARVMIEKDLNVRQAAALIERMNKTPAPAKSR
ncbi:MAG: ParB/RepB/Spo0J family partition protein, partial [Oscillospiraceae bacterium]|nr:ParB/RepB/Spo0J family partition protein [Oscillospiraceae bacterium]